jgi:hypothetical protein
VPRVSSPVRTKSQGLSLVRCIWCGLEQVGGCEYRFMSSLMLNGPARCLLVVEAAITGRNKAPVAVENSRYRRFGFGICQPGDYQQDWTRLYGSSLLGCWSTVLQGFGWRLLGQNSNLHLKRTSLLWRAIGWLGAVLVEWAVTSIPPLPRNNSFSVGSISA